MGGHVKWLTWVTIVLPFPELCEISSLKGRDIVLSDTVKT